MTKLRTRMFWLALGALLVISRAAHLNILWADEDYHLAVGFETLLGKVPYRDIWYDKPPLNALLMTAFGAWPGWPLRLFSVLLELAGAAAMYRFAGRLWSPREGYVAAALYVFFHVFYFAATAIPVEPDTLMILPHILAVYWAWSGRPLRAGFASGIAFLLNTKGLFVLAAAWLFFPGGWVLMAAGFLMPCAAMAGWLGWHGALPAYVDQVWRWGMLYAANPPPEAFHAPLARLGNWLAFHAALVLGAAFSFTRQTDRALLMKLYGWLGVSLLAAAIGWRLPPHYLHQLFPALVLLAAPVRWDHRVAAGLLAAAILIPVARFGPRYVELLTEDFRGQPHAWRDVTMDRESRDGAAEVLRIARPGDTIFVWGYRPNVVAYSRLPIAGTMWESQPVTMVPADRHLGSATPVDPEWAVLNQAALIRTRPSIIVDGLSAYNPQLDIHRFPALARWIAPYCVAGRAGQGMTIYRLCDP